MNTCTSQFAGATPGPWGCQVTAPGFTAPVAGTLQATGLFLALRERAHKDRMERWHWVPVLNLADFRAVTVTTNIKPQETYDDTTRN